MGSPSLVTVGFGTRDDARRDSSPCAFAFLIQLSVPIYGTSCTAGAALPTRSATARSRSSSPTLLPSVCMASSPST